MTRENLPAVGRELAAQIERFHVRGGMSLDEARETGDCLAELVLSLFAGQQVFFPAEPFKARELAARNAEIRAKFNGKNAPLLAREYGLSRSMIWRIVNPDN